MKHYEIAPHTADIRLVITGTTLAELFNAALEGMAHIITPHHCTPPYQHKLILEVTSMDSTTLLIDFLSDVLTQTHLHRILYCYAEFSLLTDTALQTTVYGNPSSDFEEDIKAVTYHEANVHKDEQGIYKTIIIFDI